MGGLDYVRPVLSETADARQVASSATVVDLSPADLGHIRRTVYNASTQVLYLKLGSGASASSYTVAIAASGYYEVPPEYVGVITGLWGSANGFAYVTECQ